MKIKKNPLLSEFTTFRVGGEAKSLIEVEDELELEEILKELNEKKENFFFLGNGSNVIFDDEGYDGVILTLGGEFNEITMLTDNLIEVGCRVTMPRLAKFFKESSLKGFEALGGIPGTFGGAIYMNAGAYNVSISDIVLKVKLANLKDDTTKIVTKEELGFSYRNSVLQNSEDMALKALVYLEDGNRFEIEKKMKEFSERRREKQPLNYPSAGSFYKRPKGDFAGRLIESAGLKGYSVGDAQVSEKHAGFIINRGKATFRDILKLNDIVIDRVFKDSGIKLEREVKMVRYDEK